jgi:predicted RNase H-like HicB family nuclease
MFGTSDAIVVGSLSVDRRMEPADRVLSRVYELLERLKEAVETRYLVVAQVVREPAPVVETTHEGLLEVSRNARASRMVRLVDVVASALHGSGREGVMMSVQDKLKSKAAGKSASSGSGSRGSGSRDAHDDRDKPFKKETLEEAERIAKGYTISVRQLKEQEYVGCSIELPTIEGYGDTPQACFKSTKEAVEFTVATMLEAGEVPPLPATAEQRTEQVNVKLTPLEKDMFSALAQRFGYKGLSDFIRSTVLRAFSTQ